MRTARHYYYLLLCLLFSTPALAGTNIGAPQAGLFAKIGGFLQQFVDFVEGPWSTVASILSLIVAVVIYMFADKAGTQAMLYVGRVVIAIIVILNISGVVIWLRSF